MRRVAVLLCLWLSLISAGIMMYEANLHSPMWMDEYVFYRLSSNLPQYNVTSDWFYDSRPELMNPDSERFNAEERETFRIIYDTPIYPHTPLATVLVFPAVKVLNILADNGAISHIEDSFTKDRSESMTGILRIIPICLFFASMWLAYKTIKKKDVGSNIAFTFVPLVVCSALLSGTTWFYWDSFMFFFFTLTLYLVEKNSKWAYVTACCLVNTKMFLGIMFLVPFLFKNKKMGLAALSIIPFYLTTAIVTGNLFYPFTHYLAQLEIHNAFYTGWRLSQLVYIVKTWGIIPYLVLTASTLFYIRKYPVYASFWVLTVFYGIAFGTGIYQIAGLLYSGVLVVPLIAKELKVTSGLERLATRQSWKKAGGSNA